MNGEEIMHEKEGQADVVKRKSTSSLDLASVIMLISIVGGH